MSESLKMRFFLSCYRLLPRPGIEKTQYLSPDPSVSCAREIRRCLGAGGAEIGAASDCLVNYGHQHQSTADCWPDQTAHCTGVHNVASARQRVRPWVRAVG